MLTSNGRIKLLLAVLALVFFSGMLVISALTIRTPAVKKAEIMEPESASEPAPKNAHKNFAEKQGGRGRHGAQHSVKVQPTPTPAASSLSTDNEDSDISMISVIGTIVSTIGTILSVLIAWLTYRQGQRTQKA
jgi:hypothetical protein